MNAMRFVLAVFVSIATGLSAQAEPRLYVGNTDGGDISVISIPGHEIIDTIEGIGPYIDDVAASPDGKIVYTNRIISVGLERAKNVGEKGEIMAIDAGTHEILWRIEVDGMPHHLETTADGKYLFCPLFDRLWLLVIDTEKQAVVNKLPLGYGGHGAFLGPTGERLYVGSMMLDQIAILDLERMDLAGMLTFDDAVRPFQITQDEKTMYVQLSRLHGFDVVDLESGEITRRVHLPELPDDVEKPAMYPHTVNHGLALSPDETFLFAAGSIVNYVAVYTVPDLTLVKTIPVGKEPNWIKFSPDGEYAYVTNRESDNLSIISVKELKEVKRLDVGEYPQRMAIVE